MKPQNVAGLQLVRIDFNSVGVPASVKECKPALFRDGENGYCCLLGDDPQSGIFGCGPTIEKALDDWDNDFNRRLSMNEKHDELMQSILEKRRSAIPVVLKDQFHSDELEKEWQEDYNQDPDEQSFNAGQA